MNLLFITDNFPPELNAPATRTYEHCREWVKEGMNVTVITCFPNFPKGRIFPGYNNKLYSTEYIDGIKVIRVWSFIAENKGVTKRFVDFVSFAVSGFLAGLLQKNVDKIIVTSPQFFVGFSGYLLSIIRAKPWVFEVRDLWPESILTINNYRKNLFFRVFERIEMYFYKKAEKVVVVTEGIGTSIKKRGIDPVKIRLIRNGFSFSNKISFTPKERSDMRYELGIDPDDILITYIGTHGQSHALDFVIKAIAKIKRKNIKFLFVGNGAERENLVRLANDLALTNITFLESVPKEQVFRLISISDWALVNLKKDPLFLGAIPSKIFENAAMKIPLLMGVDGEARILIEAYNAGIYFEPENETAFLQAIEDIADGKVAYTTLQQGAFNLAKDFDRKILASEMLDFVTDRKKGVQ